MPMPTEIRFLQSLERDLTKVAVAEKQRERSFVGQRRSARVRGWLTAAAMLAAVSLVVGLTVGFLGKAASNQFSTVGSAVNGAGGVRVPRLNSGTGGDQAEAPKPVAASPTSPGAASAEGAKTDLTKIVRDGAISLTIERGQFADVTTKVVTVARQNHGEVLSSSTAGGNSGTFTLRIPAKHFDEAMVELAQLGVVDSSAIHGQDVTADYLDAKAHLKILYARRKFLFGLAAKATTQSESINVQRQLEQTQLDIDKITGQLRYLNNQVAISTIKVDVHEPGAEPIDQTSSVENPSLGHAISKGIQGFLSMIGAMLIGLGYLLPLLVIAALAYVVIRFARRRRAGDEPT